MSEVENNNNEALKNELLEKQIHDVVAEFESLKNLNLEYIKTNERLNVEIKNLKELNEQQVILNDTMLDNNKSVFKSSKRNIFWFVGILSLASILINFQFIDKRINEKITVKVDNSIKQIKDNLETSKKSLIISKNLQDKIENRGNEYKLIQEEQETQIKNAQTEFKETLNHFKVNTVRTNEAISAIKIDYENTLNNFKAQVNQKSKETKTLEVNLKKELEIFKKKFLAELESLKNSKKELLTKEKTIAKKVPTKKASKPTAYNLLQQAFKYQKKQQYTDAIKMYNAVIKIDHPKKDIAYYNLGIIYGNLKKYDLAIMSYKKSLKLNPKRNLTFTNIFEIQLITNKNFENNILNLYKKYHQDKNISLIKYEMLDIFKDVKSSKNIDKKLHKWKKDYEKISLGNWSFKMLKNWIEEEKDQTTKDNLAIVLKTFENHKIKVR